MIKVAILTPLELERKAVMSQLSNWTERLVGGDIYYINSFEGIYEKYQIILRETGSKNNTVGLATERIIQAFSPSVLFLTGIAGGIKDVEIGDVVIGTKAYGYEAGKEEATRFVARPEAFRCSKALLTIGDLIKEKAQWQQRTKGDSTTCNVISGPIAAGDKVIASVNQSTYQLLKLHYNDTIALEMEAYGVGYILYNHPHIHWLNVRGISDLLENKTSKADFIEQPIAAERAAAFVFELLYQLNSKELNLIIMTTKELSKTVFELLFPQSRLKAEERIEEEIMNASDSRLHQLWMKVKPLFIEEFEEMAADPVDEDNQVAVRVKLKRALNNSKDNALKKEVEALVNTILQKQEKAAPPLIQNSKNVIVGSSISVGRDLHVGDKTSKGQTINNYGNVGKQVNIDKANGTINL